MAESSSTGTFRHEFACGMKVSRGAMIIIVIVIVITTIIIIIIIIGKAGIAILQAN